MHKGLIWGFVQRGQENVIHHEYSNKEAEGHSNAYSEHFTLVLVARITEQIFTSC